jgi:trypsin-like peptidase
MACSTICQTVPIRTFSRRSSKTCGARSATACSRWSAPSGALRPGQERTSAAVSSLQRKRSRPIGTVLGALTFGSEVLAPGAARVVFRQEDGRTNKPDDIVPIDGTLAIHPKLDMVLLAVIRQSRPVLEIDGSVMNVGDKVAAIGYPGDDPVNNPLFLAGVFKGKLGVKRAAAGEVLDGTESPLLFHDCSTTQGNSGSPIFSLMSGRVAAIHRAGLAVSTSRRRPIAVVTSRRRPRALAAAARAHRSRRWTADCRRREPPNGLGVQALHRLRWRNLSRAGRYKLRRSHPFREDRPS